MKLHNVHFSIQIGIEAVITELTRNVVKLEEVPTATNPDFTGLF